MRSAAPTLNYPTGIGVLLFGATGWTVQNNNIFGHFKWGSALFSDPFNEGDNAISQDNEFINNTNGRGGTDTNAVDFWNDGSGKRQLLLGQHDQHQRTARRRTTRPRSCTRPARLRPTPEPAPSGGDVYQVGELLQYTTSTPAREHAVQLDRASAPGLRGLRALEVTPGPDCP